DVDVRDQRLRQHVDVDVAGVVRGRDASPVQQHQGARHETIPQAPEVSKIEKAAWTSLGRPSDVRTGGRAAREGRQGGQALNEGLRLLRQQLVRGQRRYRS